MIPPIALVDYDQFLQRCANSSVDFKPIHYTYMALWAGNWAANKPWNPITAHIPTWSTLEYNQRLTLSSFFFPVSHPASQPASQPASSNSKTISATLFSKLFFALETLHYTTKCYPYTWVRPLHRPHKPSWALTEQTKTNCCSTTTTTAAKVAVSTKSWKEIFTWLHFWIQVTAAAAAATPQHIRWYRFAVLPSAGVSRALVVSSDKWGVQS